MVRMWCLCLVSLFPVNHFIAFSFLFGFVSLLNFFKLSRHVSALPKKIHSKKLSLRQVEWVIEINSQSLKGVIVKHGNYCPYYCELLLLKNNFKPVIKWKIIFEFCETYNAWNYFQNQLVHIHQTPQIRPFNPSTIESSINRLLRPPDEMFRRSCLSAE